jgi:uncharacterized Fe-S cluster-containing radical SAM superfamily protein
MTGTVYTINLDFRCNERCVFCAADIGGDDVPAAVRRPTLDLRRVQDWLGDRVPGPQDRVVLSGGEPTLHRDLVPIARHVSRGGAETLLFTNGMRLADPALSRSTAMAGVRRYEISIYGPDADSHDAITRRAGSFERTLRGLRTLSTLRQEFGIWVSVRLLVSRLTIDGNPDVIRMVAAEVDRVDSFSLNQLIRSRDALAADAPISWPAAASSINACVRMAEKLGYPFDCAPVPLCVFAEDTAPWALAAAASGWSQTRSNSATGHDDQGYTYDYLDPLLPVGTPGPRRRPALPDVCLGCRANRVCAWVEGDYLREFGSVGLRPLRLSTTAVG